MFNKIFVTISTTILAAICLVSGSVAAVIPAPTTPGYSQALTQGDLFSYTVEGSGTSFGGATEHIFTFTSTYDGNAKFIISTTNDNGGLGIGVENLTLAWDGGPSYDYTGAGGTKLNTDLPTTGIFFQALANGVDTVLRISGTYLLDGSSYTLSVLATPLPPAVIAFGTAMLGVGFLARRRRKQKQVFS